jgi:hypothetical protein
MPVTSKQAANAGPSTVAWTAPASMDKPAWIRSGRRLGALGRISNWLIGDWVREGVARWGERYAEASKITGFDPHSLRNMAYVASRFDMSLRRDNLTWSHHALIAALERDEQVQWLDRATELKWSVADLRTMMRADARKGADANASACASSQVVNCPHCGQELPMTIFPQVALDGARALGSASDVR